MEKIRVLIIEDELPGRQLLREYIDATPGMELLGEATDGYEGCREIIKHLPDLIFLDIQMPRINGLEMLELLDENQMPGVIFTTAYDEYAVKAFELNALDYLLKPFSYERFRQSVERYLLQRKQADPNNTSLQSLIQQDAARLQASGRIVVKSGQDIHIIPETDIQCLEAQDDYVMICTDKEEYLKKKTLNYYEETLNPGLFIRVHRSYIVYVEAIQKIEPYSKDAWVALLKNGRKIAVSKHGYARLRRQFDF